MANLADPLAWIFRWCLLVVPLLFLSFFGSAAHAQMEVGGSSSRSDPLDLTAERIDYRQDQEVYDATGSVVIRQGRMKLTADHVAIRTLPGILTAIGHVHLTDPQADVTAERMEINVNTEAGVATHGELHIPSTNTFVSGRLMQRFSEYHYRAKDGSFTNCDAKDGEIPAWRFRFKDLDMGVGDTLAFKGGWFCLFDVPTVPLPTFSYPLARRQTGFLIPTISYDNRFGFHMQGSFFWAINPSQDLTISPKYYSNLG